MDMYSLSKFPHCKPIIIPITRHNGESESVDKDVESLVKTFEMLRFAQPDISLKNCSRKKILEGLLNLARDENLTSKADYFLCVIISSGTDNGCFKDCNGEDIAIEEVVHIFNTESCIGLRDKPKIFIVQTDNELIRPRIPGQFGTTQEKLTLIPTQADIFIYHSHIPGFIEKFDWESKSTSGSEIWQQDKGSIFIQTLCEVLQSNPNIEIHKLTMEVNSKLKPFIDNINKRKFKDAKKELNKDLELPICTSQLRKCFEFIQRAKETAV